MLNWEGGMLNAMDSVISNELRDFGVYPQPIQTITGMGIKTVALRLHTVNHYTSKNGKIA